MPREIGLRGGLDPDCRRAFPWDESSWDHELLAFARAAFGMRASEPVLRHGTLRTVAAEAGWLAFERSATDAPGSIVVVVNAGTEPAEVTMDWLGGSTGEIEALALPAHEAPSIQRDGSDGPPRVRVGARSGAVLRVPPAA